MVYQCYVGQGPLWLRADFISETNFITIAVSSAAFVYRFNVVILLLVLQIF